MKNTNTGGGCRKILAAAIAAAMMTPQVAFADHCNGRGHLPNGECFPDLSNLNPTPPVPNLPQFTVPQIDPPDTEKYYWILPVVMGVGLVAAQMLDDDGASEFAPGNFFGRSRWHLTGELGGIGWSRLLTEKTQLTFASDFPTGKEGEVRAEIKFSF